VGIDIITPQDMFKHRRYKFIEYDGLSMPFEDNCFDIVYSQATLEHVIDIDKTYQESLRVTKLYGHVAHLASPLWNSRDGHHRADLFESFPWCHVGRSQSQFRDWVSSSEFFKGNLSQILEAVEYCFNTSNINQSPPNDYFEAVEKLGGVKVLQNSFDIDERIPVNLIPMEVVARLPKDLVIEDLIKFTHLGIVQKI
jgi:SAM-dependent methyltransferase